ncbi:D-tagatose-bisphosphate aldolase, class II, non-catalytic subunit [Lichenihabitans sp. PAMC28606]|uniref:D-tagatose-bisphosphate aldolase, class II, non-catalytic subunit n=1 Tax=Lichenihabitans sp. PAMC28606 TaxID=2880932 RepID=UPI001D09DA35|nr:D-tagatose-bisphosphate aldolase, class II, non-catalytic subunit [Lichenihabitans sp. PAMC28606]UDL93387.1 D-tagatose-bisphosphate aldolase, class II, non-catalytic subunit [Lichenihabitans sp. PAMC28606]
MNHNRIADLPAQRRAGSRTGITSVCTAHPTVIEAALRFSQAQGAPVLIEATCNQVNQHGGYTGMTPDAFRRFVETIAARVGFSGELILGGDHLGPNPWKHRPADEAMREASVMVRDFARAGFTKLHLDTSMGCAGETVALSDETTAARAASLAAIAEEAAPARETLSYVIGTEVPVPGGALETLDHLAITSPDAARQTVAVHERAFAKLELQEAFGRTVGIVVQPGVEFGNADVVPYDRAKAKALSATLDGLPHVVFEAHSTDYQSEAALAALVDDGFAILKVGPGLTFALREALYGLDAIATVLGLQQADDSLSAAMERVMLREPGSWQPYYHGDAAELRLQRHFSYSDRIRYYWPHAEAQAALSRLLGLFGDRAIPATLISQYFGLLDPELLARSGGATATVLQEAAVTRVLAIYARACGVTVTT